MIREAVSYLAGAAFLLVMLWCLGALAGVVSVGFCSVAVCR